MAYHLPANPHLKIEMWGTQPLYRGEDVGHPPFGELSTVGVEYPWKYERRMQEGTGWMCMADDHPANPHLRVEMWGTLSLEEVKMCAGRQIAVV